MGTRKLVLVRDSRLLSPWWYNHLVILVNHQLFATHGLVVSATLRHSFISSIVPNFVWSEGH